MNGKQLLAAAALVMMTASIVGGNRSYNKWKRAEISRIRSGGRLIETASGPVECHIEGSGPAILIAHGTPGGYDQGVAFSKLLDKKYTFIAVSRPGYLQTPLSSGRSPQEQADLYAALLDTLHISQATVVGISGGAPSALQFAIRHPERCQKLVIVSGVTQRYAAASWTPGKRLFRNAYDNIAAFGPLLFFLLPFAKFLPNASIAEAFLHSQTASSLRKIGYDNDMEQFAHIDAYPYERISAPTFLLHGTADQDVPFSDAELLARRLPRVQFLAIKGGNHSSFYTHAGLVRPLLNSFLKL
ncbi:MAG TPA: alpha/beta hydrolase [Ktedonobacteraceae bacterium]|nr:alpha/beta hydrolase [Ktedonobacteraceae bacterium]